MSYVKNLPGVEASRFTQELTLADLPTDVDFGETRYVVATEIAYVYTPSGWEPMVGGGGGSGVTSVNGDTGPAVLLDTDDIPEGATNLYYTEARVEAHVFTNLQATAATIDTLTVTTATFLDSAIVEVGDNIIVLNALVTGAPTTDAGIEIERGTQTDAQLLWNETADRWQFGVVGNLKNITALSDISATNPVFFDNTTGVISLGVVPISLGGTGQSNVTAAINSLTNPLMTATDGQVFAWSAGNAQFIDLQAASVHGPANKFAYFNATGVLDDLTPWEVEPTYQSSQSFLVLTAPADAGDVYPQNLALYTSVESVNDTTQFHPASLRVELTMDNNVTGFDIQDPVAASFNSRHHGPGTIQNWIMVDNSHLVGNGSNAGVTNVLKTFNNNLSIGANYTVNDLQYSNNQINSNGTVLGNAYIYNTGIYSGGGTYEYLYVNNLDINVPTSFDVTGYNLSINNTIDRNITGFSYFNSATQTDPTGQVNSYVSNFNGNVAGNRIIWNAFGNGDTGVDYRHAIWANDGDVGNNGAGLLMYQGGAVARNYTGIATLYQAATLGQTGDNHFLFDGQYTNAAAVYLGNLNGINLNFNGVSTDANVQTVSIYNSVSGNSFGGINQQNIASFTEEIRLINLSSSGNARTLTGAQLYLGTAAITDDARGYNLQMDPTFTATDFTGADFNVQGTFSNSVRGMTVRVSNAVSSNPASPPTSLQLEGGTWNFNSVYTPPAGGFFDIGNISIATIDVPSGTPLTGAEVFAQLFVTQMAVQDDVATGPIGLGFSTGGFVTNLGIAAGKTVSAPMSGFVVAATVQPVPYADGGTIDDYRSIDVPGILAFGGSAVVNEYKALYLRPGFDGFATVNWGVRVEGTSADNFFNKLAIGTGDFKTDSGYLLEVEGKSLFHDSADVEGDVRIITAGKGLAVFEGADAKMGVATLVAGTVTVANTSITANSRVFTTIQAAGGTLGVHAIANIVPATSFDIVSNSVLDTSTVAYIIIEGA
jgi:hypothetical protein